LVGIVSWTEDLTGKRQQAVFLLGITELKTQNKKPFYERKTRTPTVEAPRGRPLVGTEDCAKSNQKGVLAAGRFAPASRLILR
jgi:hypothetical protein